MNHPKPPFPEQPQGTPGHTDQLEPRPDHGEDSYKGSGKLEGMAALVTGGDSGIGRAAARAHEEDLITYATQRVRDLNWITIHGTQKGKGAIMSFSMEGAHPHDVATIVDRSGIAIRAGQHCAEPLMTHLNVPGTARAS